MPTWTDRAIRGPAEEFLTAEEFGKLFGVSDAYVRDLAKAGAIPMPVKHGKKEFWSWEAAIYYSIRLKMPFSTLVSGGASSE